MQVFFGDFLKYSEKHKIFPRLREGISMFSIKAAPHNYCRSIAKSDFSADCTN